jgi:transposase
VPLSHRAHSRKGDPYLRKLPVLGPTAVIRYSRNKPGLADWINALLTRRPARVVTLAVANKLARIVWAIMQRGSPPGTASRNRVEKDGLAMK